MAGGSSSGNDYGNPYEIQAQAIRDAASIQADAAIEAAQIQKDTAMEGLDYLQKQYDQSRQVLKPYVAAGERGTRALEDILGMNGQEAMQKQLNIVTGGTQFQTALDLGREQLEKSAAAKGTLQSGGFATDLQRYTTQTLLGGIGQQQSALGQLAGMGANAAAATSGAYQNQGQSGLSTYQSIGSTSAEAKLAAANAQSQGILAESQIRAAQAANYGSSGGGGNVGAILGASAGGMVAGPAGVIAGTGLGALADLIF